MGNEQRPGVALLDTAVSQIQRDREGREKRISLARDFMISSGTILRNYPHPELGIPNVVFGEGIGEITASVHGEFDEGDRLGDPKLIKGGLLLQGIGGASYTLDLQEDGRGEFDGENLPPSQELEKAILVVRAIAKALNR